MARSILILSLLTIVTIIILAGAHFPVIEWIEWIRIYIQNLGAYGVVVFVILYSAVALLMIPILPLTLLAGLVYGIWGFALVMLSAILAACLAFLLARKFLHARVSALMNNKVIFTAIKRAATREQWKIVILLRMSPMLSFAMQNYLLAITDIRFWPYIIGSAVGMTPAIAFYVYLGSLGSFADDGSLPWWLVVVGVVATIAVLVLISYRTKQAINQIKIEYQDN